MLPIKIPGVPNHILRAPEGMEEIVLDLPYVPVQDNDGIPHIYCCFQLNKEELEQVISTGKIYVGFMGLTIPPVRLSVENPFETNL